MADARKTVESYLGSHSAENIFKQFNLPPNGAEISIGKDTVTLSTSNRFMQTQFMVEAMKENGINVLDQSQESAAPGRGRRSGSGSINSSVTISMDDMAKALKSFSEKNPYGFRKPFDLDEQGAAPGRKDADFAALTGSVDVAFQSEATDLKNGTLVSPDNGGAKMPDNDIKLT